MRFCLIVISFSLQKIETKHKINVNFIFVIQNYHLQLSDILRPMGKRIDSCTIHRNENYILYFSVEINGQLIFILC